jgi:hypothetical protein
MERAERAERVERRRQALQDELSINWEQDLMAELEAVAQEVNSQGSGAQTPLSL